MTPRAASSRALWFCFRSWTLPWHTSPASRTFGCQGLSDHTVPEKEARSQVHHSARIKVSASVLGRHGSSCPLSFSVLGFLSLLPHLYVGDKSTHLTALLGGLRDGCINQRLSLVGTPPFWTLLVNVTGKTLVSGKKIGRENGEAVGIWDIAQLWH